MLLSEGQMSDHKGARLMLGALPKAKTLIADRGYDSNRFRKALKERGTEPCIPPTKSRKTPLDYDKTIYRQRHKIENLFAKLKDWRRIATRYDRCAHPVFSAICIAAAVNWAGGALGAIVVVLAFFGPTGLLTFVGGRL